MNASGLSRGRRFALASVLVIVVGSIGPWVDAAGESLGGLDKDGTVTIFFALIAAVYLFTSRPHWAPVAVLGGVVAAVAIFDIIDVEDLAGLIGDFVEPGWGIYLTAIGGIALVVSAAFAMRTGEEADAPIGVLGFVIVGACMLLVVAFVASAMVSDNEMANSAVEVDPVELDPVELEP